MKKLLIISVFASLISLSLKSQQSIKDSTVALWGISPQIAAQFPMADLADRFGANAALGISLFRKLESNWTFGITGDFIFGNEVKEDSLAYNIRTADGVFLDDNGERANVLIQQRGLNAYLSMGRIIAFDKPNPNSGLLVKLGGGFLLHRIRFEARQNDITAIEGENQKGYDRLTSGLVLNQFIGYQHFSNDGRVNFFVGLELHEAFTQSRRSFNYDLMRRDTENRLDMLFGLRFGWVLPLYKKAGDDYLFN